jgi:3',5'-cyclic AMP phosphodiesterase CpdA
MKTLRTLLILALLASGCGREQAPKPDFTFAFLTDIHITPDRSAPEKFRRAIDTVNVLKPDFVLTGGDLIMDALWAKRSRADSLYQLYISLIKGFQMPVYHTVGNHELYAFYTRDIDTTDLDYGDGMYRKYLGNPWYSFDHKGWHFIVLKSIEQTPGRTYQGEVSGEQLEWLRNDLAMVDSLTPIAVSVHIPLITVYDQWREGGQYVNGPANVITNGREVMDLLRTRNIRLILQGHLHLLEEMVVDGVHVITGGAVSAGWWEGPLGKLKEGFLLLEVYGQDVKWEYVEYLQR